MAGHSRDDQVALEVIGFLAQLGSLLDAAKVQLQQTFNLSPLSFVESRRYGNDVYVCVCMVAEVESGQTLTWWLDFKPAASGWLVEGSIMWNGRELAFQFPPHMIADFRMVERDAPRALKTIIEAGLNVLRRDRSGAVKRSDSAAARQ